MRSLLTVFAIFACLLLSVATVSAAGYNPFDNATTTGSSAVCTASKDTTNPVAGPNGIIVKVTNIVAVVAGAASVVVLLVASIRYITSNGDSAGINSAKQTIIYALVGIAVIVLAHSLIVFVVSKIN
jgi:hypothetical protein